MNIDSKTRALWDETATASLNRRGLKIGSRASMLFTSFLSSLAVVNFSGGRPALRLIFMAAASAGGAVWSFYREKQYSESSAITIAEKTNALNQAIFNVPEQP